MSSSLPLIVSLELGSSGVRSAIVDINGVVLASSMRSIETIAGDDGSMVQDANAIWAVASDCIIDSLKSDNINVSDIAALTCSGQYGSVVPVAKNGEPVGPLYLYSDVRGSSHTVDFYEKNPESFQHLCDVHGRLISGNGEDPLSSMLFVRESEPEIWDKTFCFLEPMDYLQARLTGRCVATQGSNHSWMMIDNRQFNSTQYDPKLMEFTGINGEKLPQLVAMGSVIGLVQPDIAAQLGLPQGTQVIAGTNDTQTLAIGTGAERGQIGFSIGTTAVPVVFANRIDPATNNLHPFDFDSGVLTMAAPIEADSGVHLANVELGYGGKALEFVLKNFVFASDELGDHSVDDLYHQLDLAMEKVEPGSNGLIFFPWLDGSWLPGLDDNAGGGFINMSFKTTREEMVRSVMEGVAYQLRWILPALTEFAGRDLNVISFAGGGARSDVWAQIVADVTGITVQRQEHPELANCRGAAMLAFHNLDMIDLTKIADWRQVDKTFEPRQEYLNRYKVMGDAFIKAHEQLAPVHEMLAGLGA